MGSAALCRSLWPGDPRDAIRLLVDLLFAEKDADLTEAGIVRTLYEPTAGTGGMLALAEEHLLAQNPDAKHKD